ncbi:hypothetical protein MRX96_009548 [Rhipicephalus microplus]
MFFQLTSPPDFSPLDIRTKFHAVNGVHNGREDRFHGSRAETTRVHRALCTHSPLSIRTPLSPTKHRRNGSFSKARTPAARPAATHACSHGGAGLISAAYKCADAAMDRKIETRRAGRRQVAARGVVCCSRSEHWDSRRSNSRSRWLPRTAHRVAPAERRLRWRDNDGKEEEASVAEVLTRRGFFSTRRRQATVQAGGNKRARGVPRAAEKAAHPFCSKRVRKEMPHEDLLSPDMVAATPPVLLA